MTNQLNKNLLIVGCGYLGLRVLNLATQQGWTVFGTSRKIEKKSEIEAAGARFIHFDITRPETCRNLPVADSWLWCPAFDRSQGLSVHEVVNSGLIRTLEMAPAKPARLLFTSTTSVFHQSDGQWVDENSPAIPATDSGKAHLAAEQSLAVWAESSRSQSITLRLSGLYGPGRWIRKAAIEKREPIPCDPETWLNLLHINDAASACMTVLNDKSTSSTHHIYCLTDNRPITRGEYYRTFARFLNAPEPVFTKPDQHDFTGNKKVRNTQFKLIYNWEPAHPDITSGLKSLINTD